MATYHVTGPKGEKYEVTGPEGASDADIIAQVHSQMQPAAPDERSFGQRAEAAATAANVDTGPDTQGPLGLYADTVKQYPANMTNIQNHGYAMLRSGLHDLGQGDMSGIIGAGIGGASFLGAPFAAPFVPVSKPINTFVSQPVEDLTGIPAPITTAGILALAPGAGITKGPMTVRPSTSAFGMSRPAGEVLLRQLSTDDTITGTGAARIHQGGRHAMVADAGPAASNLLDTAMQRSGPGATAARQAVEQRATQANADLRGTLDRTMGPPSGVEAQQADIRTGTAPARAQAYNAAYRQPIDYTSIHGRNIERLVDRVPQEAVNQANRMMRAEGQASRQIRATINDDGTVSFEQLPDVRQLDYITRGLNEVAQGAEGQGALRGTTAVGRIYGNLSQEIRRNLREAVTEYGTALDTAADPIQRVQATEFGATILNPQVTRDQVAMRLQGMGAGERQAVVSGLRAQIDEISTNVKEMASDPNIDARQLRETLKSLSSQAAREKIEAALGPAATQQLMTQMAQSSRALELRASVATNSRTYGRQATAAQVAAQAEPGIIGLAMEGHPLNAARKFVQSLTRMTPERRLAMEDRIYGEIADALTRHRGAAAVNFLGQLRSEIMLRAGTRARDAQRVVGATTTTPARLQAATPSPSLPVPSMQAEPQQDNPRTDQARRMVSPPPLRQGAMLTRKNWTGQGGPGAEDLPPLASGNLKGESQSEKWERWQRIRGEDAARVGQAAAEIAGGKPGLSAPPDPNSPMQWTSRGPGDRSEIIQPGVRQVLDAMAGDYKNFNDVISQTIAQTKALAGKEHRDQGRFSEQVTRLGIENSVRNELEAAQEDAAQQGHQKAVEGRRQSVRDLIAELLAHHGRAARDVPHVSAPRNF